VALGSRAGLLIALVVASALTTFIAAMAAVVQANKAQALEVQKLGVRDSVTAQVFGFERQFLRFRADLAAAIATGFMDPPRSELALRQEILASRIRLLTGSPSLEMLRGQPEFEALLPHLQLLENSRSWLQAEGPAPMAQARELLEAVDAMTPDVQSFSNSAMSNTAQLIENQYRLLHGQATVITSLAALQLLLLALAVYALWTRHKEEAAARNQLEQLADELREAKLAAEAAARAKSQFLANMSHELRTPFQGVLGMLQLLQRTALSTQQTELVHTASQSAAHLLSLLNEILDISAIEAGKVVLHDSAINLQRLVEDVAQLMRVQADERGLTMTAVLEPSLPAWVVGDGTRIKQILFNLLNNAVKFTPAGHVRLEAGCSGSEDGRAHVYFEVVDTGIGMDEATQARLFRRFEPGDSRLSRRFGGTGLGLEISRNLARLMGGELVATSRLGEGSRFLLTLPLPQASAPALPHKPAAVTLQRPLHVLIADDHPINQRYLALVLATLGHRADVCDNGEEAVEIVQTDDFDVVLMDVHMPVMDGLAATRAIRALGGAYAKLPVIALTADVVVGSRERALAAGVTSFLGKPVQMEDLATALAAVVAGTAVSVPVRAPASRVARSRYEELAASLPQAQLRELLRMFFADEAGVLAQLRAAVIQGSPATVCEAAHKYKGAARMIGLDGVAQTAQEIEAWAGRGAPSQDKPGLLQRLDAELAAAQATTCTPAVATPASG
jgi:two-component system, sensor histidine kinase